MNVKRWFAWVCLALMLVAEILLFRANHERDAALTALRDARQQLRQTQTDLEDLKTSSAGLQVAEISGLRKQNEVLTGKVSALQKSLDDLSAESQQTAQHLTTARTALQLQQEHLKQLQTEQQQTALVASANACLANLRQLDAAKQQWALENAKTIDAVPKAQDLLPYLKDGIFPACPEGGKYAINSVGEPPTCSIPGHALTP